MPKKARKKPTLEDAIRLAVRLHARQVDKQGKPYILHPLRVMMAFGNPIYPEEYAITAVLHDVVEDCGITLGKLRKLGYSQKVLRALDSLTKRPEERGENYMKFVRRVSRGGIMAINVKLADIEDNTDPERMPEGEDAEVYSARMKKYEEAREFLGRYALTHHSKLV